MKIVVLASELGDRLYPAVSEDLPKAFLSLYSHNPLLSEVIFQARFLTENDEDIFVVLPTSVREGIDTPQNEFGLPHTNIIYEPEFKNLNTSMMLATYYLWYIANISEEEPVLFLTADSFAFSTEAFIFHLANAVEFCTKHPNSVSTLLHRDFAYSSNSHYCTLERTVYFTEGEVVEGDDITIHTTFYKINNIITNPSDEELDSLPENVDLLLTEMFISSMGNWKSIYEQHLSDSWGSLLSIMPKMCILKSGWFSNESYITLDQEKSKEVWDSIDCVDFYDLLKTGNISIFGADAVGLFWCKLDNWATVKALLCDSGIYQEKFTPELHLVDSSNNYVYKPVGKDVALFGVTGLIIIDDGKTLLIGTPDSIYENL